MMGFRRCQHAVALILAREDRPLNWRERLALYVHLAGCHACPRFARQVHCMRRALQHWRRHVED